eukprot:364645-Chlamydomonas_euryale.AAC.3
MRAPAASTPAHCPHFFAPMLWRQILCGDAVQRGFDADSHPRLHFFHAHTFAKVLGGNTMLRGFGADSHPRLQFVHAHTFAKVLRGDTVLRGFDGECRAAVQENLEKRGVKASNTASLHVWAGRSHWACVGAAALT